MKKKRFNLRAILARRLEIIAFARDCKSKDVIRATAARFAAPQAIITRILNMKDGWSGIGHPCR